ncbi:MAG: ABC transporter ATP-binding protein [Gammaproteobacteria bacterium]|nr:ABC transporter ATP-binding protein [Gammaproteobacteria bacterium]MCP5201727.1 ABC transporter ATP-binding protein [Gammaproteobacteria bacterium]
METLIEVNGLSKNFGTLRAVDDVSLEVRRGEVLGFLGPNGAGKSTTMKMITGFLAPSAGHIRVAGFDIDTHPLEAKARIGYLPEGAPAYGEMTAAGFLDFIADVRGIARAHRAARIREVVEQIHLERVLEQRIETLSKGFKRRVGLAQAILHDPEILIMDEPTDGLDPNQKHEVRTLIQAMAPTKAILISTHILEEVDAVCTRAVIIAQGRLIFSGTPRELAARSRYHNAVTVIVATDAVEPARAALATLGEVETRGNGSDARLTLFAPPGENPAARARATLADAGVAAQELFIEHGHLDEVFRSITLSAGDSGEVHRT